ncbi:RicAFT regulatory complex protein RicA family protein [Neobacillus sp. C211]|uniref:Master regulator for biofilm formation n=1 Tax=Priestia megaterium TaxID=1404 RepID=A0A6H1P1T9_PRIMG|nr:MULTISPECIES: RicAFT regulatory complex protein RicA family protein [Bacillaceae]MBT2700071.1 RicAFT regulatory complex protein RicA family protein [Bacillus sp. ISL-40]MBT2720610.1 RicAFT regulatory complex protein RicA family protein [Bacillus sp. ISL-46]MBT2725876.1 RicAFT regulatory complex protein RicA family protein [Bacillus sp. ISL-75]MBT2735578.1 RicAFT regulatory complex protein RicA family protein [Bacillus sp. ISL-7]MBT2741273.1 RicAFT regulatory complex protein RicA family prot
MAKYTKDDIVARATDLARMIAETEEVDFFKRAEAQLNENKKVHTLIADIKGLQKQAVNLQHYGKPEALKKVEDKIASIEQELDEIPVVQDFKQSQLEVNELLQIIASTISNTVTDEIIISTGGDVLLGETGSSMQNGGGACEGHDDCDHDH